MKLRDAVLACATARFGEVPDRVQKLCELLFGDKSAHSNVEVTEPSQVSRVLLTIAAEELGLRAQALHGLLHQVAGHAGEGD